MREQLRLFLHVELAEILDQRMIEKRLDLLLEASGPLEVHLPSQLDRHAESDRKLDCEVRVLLFIEPAEEAEVLVGLRDDGALRVLTVVDHADVLEARAGLRPVARDRGGHVSGKCKCAVQRREVRHITQIEAV